MPSVKGLSVVILPLSRALARDCHFFISEAKHLDIAHGVLVPVPGSAQFTGSDGSVLKPHIGSHIWKPEVIP